ncbi:MAG: hypothetical protein WDN26_12490 [Chitinophagaceae bacterium]
MNSEYQGTHLGDEGLEERLWEYIDGVSSKEEKSVIEKLLVSNSEWKSKYHELLEVHQLMKSSELEEPSMRFTKNVMDEIARLQIAPAAKTYINKNIIRGLAAFFITMIVGFLIYGLAQVDWTTGTDSKLPVDLSKVDYSKIFSNTYMNAFMMINVILGLFLFDRVLANKRKKFRGEI